MFDKARRCSDLFGCPVAIEGQYPAAGDDPHKLLVSSWPEYRAVLDSGVPYALDLSHLNILAHRTGQRDDTLVAGHESRTTSLVFSDPPLHTRTPAEARRAYEAGAGVLDLLATGCPLDLARLPIGAGTRTVFDSVQVVLTREAEDRFHLVVWRSFAPHVRALLDIAERELAAGL